MDYALLRSVHVGTVAVTLSLFLLRAAWMLMDSPLRQQRWVRIVPHLNDTLLIAAAIGMVVVSGVGWAPWIIAKVLGLLVYIALGTVALKRGRTKTQRLLALVGALAVFAYIITIAASKQPLPGLS